MITYLNDLLVLVMSTVGACFVSSYIATFSALCLHTDIKCKLVMMLIKGRMIVNLGKSYLIFLGVIFIGAYGSGCSSDEAASTVPITAPVPFKLSSFAIIANANSYTAEQLKAAASELASTRYISNEKRSILLLKQRKKRLIY
jgi:hypothetical protein